MDELIADFLTEAKESLEVLDNELVMLEKNPDDKDLLGSIFRVMHTIKGTCGFLGLPRLEAVAHSGENIMDRIRDGKLQATPDKVSMILEVIDCIKGIVEHLEENEGQEPEGNDGELITRVNAAAEGQETAPPVQEPITESATPVASAGEKTEEEINKEADFTPVPANQTAQVAPPAGEKTEEEINKEADFTPVPASQTAQATPPAGEKTEEEINKEADFTPVPANQTAQVAPPAGEKTEEEINKEADFTPVPANQTAQVAPPAGEKTEEEINKEADFTPVLAVPQEPQSSKGSKKSAASTQQQSIRVNLDILEELMQEVSELVLNRNQLIQIERSVGDSEFTVPIQRLSHITSELQEKVMKTRMQPISTAWAKFPRLIRDLSKDLSKKIELEMIGEETELDRQLIEAIKDPLTHMVRNSCDHGLETAEERLAAGKSEVGTVTLKAYHQGGHIIMEVTDDGRGLNIEKIKEKIISNKMITSEQLAALTEQQIMQYVFKAGFSTAAKVTSVSGRGVGMDVVKSNIEKISGNVELHSVVGKGSSFIIKIPLTLAIMPILIIESSNLKFGIPQINIIELVKTGNSSGYETEEINGNKLIRLRGDLLPLITLNDILELDKYLVAMPNISDEETEIKIKAEETEQPVQKEGASEQQPVVEAEEEKEEEAIVVKSTSSVSNDNMSDSDFVVVCDINGQHFGLIVDKIYDTEEIVVKPVSPILKEIGLYSGNTLLGDGQIIMILDPVGLLGKAGDIKDLSAKESKASNEQELQDQEKTNFLVMQVSGAKIMAVPLDLVSRLEEIDIGNIEMSQGKRVVQYRGNLMYLTEADSEYVYPESGVIQIVVFLNRDKILGLVVEEIMDIANEVIDEEIAGTTNMKTMVINGKTTDLVSINDCFAKVFDIRSSKVGAPTLGGGGKPRLLMLDDSPFFRKFIPPMLIEVGYQVEVTDSGARALEILEKDKNFDMIITDINMPGMDGNEFAFQCFSDDSIKHIPIVALTANSGELDKGDRSTMIKQFISKTNHEDILGAIHKVLSNNKGAA